MDIFLQLNGRREGPFTVDEVSRRVQSGEVSLSALSWRPGSREWIPLRSFEDIVEKVVPAISSETTTVSAPYSIPECSDPPRAERRKLNVLSVDDGKKWTGAEMTVLFVLTVIIPLIGLVVGAIGVFSSAKRKQGISLFIVGVVIVLLWCLVGGGNNSGNNSAYDPPFVSKKTQVTQYDGQATRDAYAKIVEISNISHSSLNWDLIKQKQYTSYIRQANDEADDYRAQVRKLQSANASPEIDPYVRQLNSQAQEYYQLNAEHCDQLARIGAAFEQYEEDYQSAGALVSAFIEGYRFDFSRISKQEKDQKRIKAEIESNNRSAKRISDAWTTLKQSDENVRAYLKQTY